MPIYDIFSAYDLVNIKDLRYIRFKEDFEKYKLIHPNFINSIGPHPRVGWIYPFEEVSVDWGDINSDGYWEIPDDTK